MMNSAANFGTLFTVAALIGVLSCLVWWFIRKRRKEIQMPIVRILEIPQTKLPKIVLRKPPLIPFIAFSLALAGFLVWMAKPRIQSFANHEPKQLRVHVFVDMSPSISAHVSSLDFGRQVGTLWQELKNVSRVTLSTSHGQTIYDVQEGSKVEDILQGLGFHRAGTQIGQSIKRHLIETGEVDRLIIVSDKDQASWSGFQWKYLSGETDVVWYNVAQKDEAVSRSNVFINSIRVVSPPGATNIEWDIDISQGGIAKAQEGSLRAMKRGETLATSTWKLAEGSKNVTVRLVWPLVNRRVPVSRGVANDDQDEPIVWELDVLGEDAIDLDNQFRTTEFGRGGRVRIVSEPSGENALEDPGSGLQLVLRVMGVQSERVDALPSAKQSDLKRDSVNSADSSAELWILLGGLERGLDTFCPSEELKNVWIVPWAENIDHEELCMCASRIMKTASPECQLIHTPDDWIGWWSGQGAKQVGGTIGQLKDAVAMSWSSPELSDYKVQILGMTVPLRPSATFGISHGQFPILVRQLYFWKTFGDAGSQTMTQPSDWPRVADISQTTVAGAFVFAARSRLGLTNVPLGESLLTSEAPGNLPRQWDSVKANLSGRGPGKLDSEDPVPWIKAVVTVVLVASLIELLWLLHRRRKKRLLAASIILFFAFVGANWSSAQVSIEFHRVPAASTMTFNRLAKEVSARTSIEMAEKGGLHDGTNQRWLSQPWLWLRSTEGLTDRDGGMKASLVRWIKRGGFLMIESTGGDDSIWDKFVTPLAKGSFRPLGWNPVPQDHELMRSFYLLATLPSCNGQLWRWYGIDGRLAMLQAPYHFSAYLQDQGQRPACESLSQIEYQSRVFVNILMVAFTTDYKRDQIHLPEILKRLRTP